MSSIYLFNENQFHPTSTDLSYKSDNSIKISVSTVLNISLSELSNNQTLYFNTVDNQEVLTYF